MIKTIVVKEPETEIEREKEIKPCEKPAATLVKSWAKKMAQGRATIIPVFVGGVWRLQVPRGNKRVLTVQVDQKKN